MAASRHLDLGTNAPLEDGQGDRHRRQGVVAGRVDDVVVTPRRAVGRLHRADADGEQGRAAHLPHRQGDERADDVRLALGPDVVVVVGYD